MTAPPLAHQPVGQAGLAPTGLFLGRLVGRPVRFVQGDEVVRGVVEGAALGWEQVGDLARSQVRLLVQDERGGLHEIAAELVTLEIGRRR